MNKIYLITGTSRGLGHALVKELIKSRENKVFCIQRSMGGEKRRMANANFYRCDLSNAKKLPELMNCIFNDIDFKKVESITLINNAGVLSPIKSIHNASVEEIGNNIDVNLKALIILTSLFLQKTQKLDIKKTVINISSGAAIHPYDGWSVYCGTKAGVDQFTRCVSLEQARQRHPADIFAFYPYIIDTGMQALIRKSDKKDFPKVKKFIGYKKNGNLLSAAFVAKTLLNFANGNNFENGGIYDIEDIT
jgi:benzil reductase ((S)-benzoin forming)